MLSLFPSDTRCWLVTLLLIKFSCITLIYHEVAEPYFMLRLHLRACISPDEFTKQSACKLAAIASQLLLADCEITSQENMRLK